MSTELLRQRALLEALHSGVEPAGTTGTTGMVGGKPGVARGLQALRDNAAGLAVRTLAVSHEDLQQDLGQAQFASLAWAFWCAAPPQRGDLAEWGAGLADFMAQGPEVPAPWIDKARLLWARHQVERAADGDFDATSLALLGQKEPESLRLVLAPGLRVLHQSTGALLVWRQGWRALQTPLGEEDALFMQALGSQSLGLALVSVLAVHPQFDFSAWLARSLAEGWLLGAAELQEDSNEKTDL